jgi:hypothetical protein
MTTTEGKTLKKGDRVVFNERARVWTSGKVFTVDHVAEWGARCWKTAEGEAARLPDDQGRIWYAALWDEIAEVVHGQD